METLTQMKCVACRKDEPMVTTAEIAEFHPQVSDWEILELDGIKRLRRVFSFDDFAQALEFEGRERDLIVSWARIDPSLHALRSEREEDFFALLGTYTSPKIPTPKAP
jgi:4a-hydroxytetrahydrobiopterin dehydratase